MKKIIAILLALAVVSMAFAQTVSITNTLKTEPAITIDGGAHYWGFANSNFLRDEVVGEAITADGRARVKARIRFDLQTLTPFENSILNFKPRWSWNSDANAADGNRSKVAALLKPIDQLEIGIGNLGDFYAVGCGPSLSYKYWTDDYQTGWNVIPGLAGSWQNVHYVVGEGIHVAFVGVPNLKIVGGLISAGAERDTRVKKSVFRGAAFGATYDTDVFSVGANWKGNFGYTTARDAVANASYLAEGTDKAYQDHTIYAGFTFKALQEAKIGTTIDAGVGFYTQKASALANNSVAQTAFLFGVGAGFNFRNGITDDVSVAVGYYKSGSDKAKVLPFAIKNNISYSVSSDAKFSFDLVYSQSGLKESTKVKAASNTSYDPTTGITRTTPDNTPTVNGECGWLLAAKPTFEWTNGAHKFSIGVKTVTLGDIVPHAKSGWEWGWTGLRGIKADVSFPLSWTYTF
jgi:hypothetical protein